MNLAHENKELTRHTYFKFPIIAFSAIDQQIAQEENELEYFEVNDADAKAQADEPFFNNRLLKHAARRSVVWKYFKLRADKKFAKCRCGVILKHCKQYQQFVAALTRKTCNGMQTNAQ